MLNFLSQSETPTYTMSQRSDFSIKSNQNNGVQVDDMDLLVFDLSTIAKATSNFTVKNKIGEGILDLYIG